jgi:hypothetical protein
MRSGLLAPACLLLASCATATDVGLPDGSTGYALNCSGTAMSWGMCLKKAGEVCRGHGYDILARDQHTGQTTIITANPNYLYGGTLPTVDREMIVRCRV